MFRLSAAARARSRKKSGVAGPLYRPIGLFISHIVETTSAVKFSDCAVASEA